VLDIDGFHVRTARTSVPNALVREEPGNPHRLLLGRGVAIGDRRGLDQS
jgi:hypothetical protein